MRPLIIGLEEKAAIKRVLDYAEHHPLTLSTIKRMMAGELPPPGDDNNYACNLPVGFKAVYTLEQHPLKEEAKKPGEPETIWLRHLSISVSTDNNTYPHPAACDMILEEFGFVGGIKNCQVWIENDKDPTLPTAVNMLQEREKE